MKDLAFYLLILCLFIVFLPKETGNVFGTAFHHFMIAAYPLTE